MKNGCMLLKKWRFSLSMKELAKLFKYRETNTICMKKKGVWDTVSKFLNHHNVLGFCFYEKALFICWRKTSSFSKSILNILSMLWLLKHWMKCFLPKTIKKSFMIASLLFIIAKQWDRRQMILLIIRRFHNHQDYYTCSSWCFFSPWHIIIKFSFVGRASKHG